MPLIKDAKFLRILRPDTRKGTIIKHLPDGRTKYLQSFARLNPISKRAFEDANRYLPRELRMIIEVVDNPDYIPGRAPTQKKSSRRNENPRPAHEQQARPISVDISAIEAKLRAELKAEFEARYASQDKHDESGPKGASGIPGNPGLSGVDPNADKAGDDEAERKRKRNERDRIRREAQRLEANNPPQPNISQNLNDDKESN